MKNKAIYLFLIILFVPMKILYCNEQESILNHCAEILAINPLDLSVKKFSSGVSNRVYLLTNRSGEKFVAKLFTKKSINEVIRIEEIVLKLQKAGFLIPKTINISLFQNSFPLHISKFQKGLHITDDILEKAAKLMGKLHIEGSSLASNYIEKYKQKKHFENLFKKCKDWELTSKLKEIYEELDLSYLSKIPTGLIHGDFSYTNLILNSGNNVVLIDFDHICISYLLTDLVRCQMFYGFDENGFLLEEKIKHFTNNYHFTRPLTSDELNNFYTHMKLMMIDAALEMYYHHHIIKDLAINVLHHKDNKCLIPGILAKKIINIRNKKEITIINNTYKTKPIIFFGMSGVGKTTIIQELNKQSPNLFYIPILTCTRHPRPDDETSQFEYISIDKFLELESKNEFLFTMKESNRYYGYRKSNLTDINRYPLLNCSAYGINNLKNLSALLILIQGDAEKGLLARNNSKEFYERTFINQKILNDFYSKDWFLDKIDIIQFNEWHKIKESTLNLKEKILEKIHYKGSDKTYYKAA
jgi:homoserine kinase type II